MEHEVLELFRLLSWTIIHCFLRVPSSVLVKVTAPPAPPWSPFWELPWASREPTCKGDATPEKKFATPPSQVLENPFGAPSAPVSSLEAWLLLHKSTHRFGDLGVRIKYPSPLGLPTYPKIFLVQSCLSCPITIFWWFLMAGQYADSYQYAQGLSTNQTRNS